MNKHLYMDFYYNRNLFEKHTIERMAERYKSYLLQVIEHCVNKEDFELTPSDFTSCDLDFDTLNEVFNIIENL
ncbi:condensation domain-containing protein [Bacillus sp. OR9]|nr:condensation domain-containing protein [Bacillus sp. OR9]